ncbi:iron ABC transporter permease [Hahella sp. CCB-MM4]|uniref:FecCD family ABC transporter permease n=1 Tax=Hahella sp. (strain CCB-MM4) TaxID=1926491 RepID=UPI000B9C04AF|nr:iron ABC transporter permease [Hahella sp. CCB-MM4]OZG73153.1 iron ABC transporter permease [Hahella sp. CCB-MM4]
MDKLLTLRTSVVSIQLNSVTLKMLGTLLIGTLAIALMSLSAGSQWLNPIEVVKELLLSEPGQHAFVIETLRLPRVVTGFLVGGALAVSGLILQSLVRNPLASPDIIGITSGASAAAVFFLSYLAETVSALWLPFAAILGAALTSLIIYLLAWRQGVTPLRLILIGIGLVAGLGAMTTFMIVLSPIATSMMAYVWLTGSIYGSDWQDVTALLPWLLVLLPLSLMLSRTINVQELGDPVTVGLGVQVQRTRFVLLAISVALAGSAVAYAGAIGFVGLIAPHIARQLVPRSFGSLAPASLLIGGCLVVVADTIGRTAFLPLDVPAGVFVSAVGAPFFIYLLYRQHR